MDEFLKTQSQVMDRYNRDSSARCARTHRSVRAVARPSFRASWICSVSSDVRDGLTRGRPAVSQHVLGREVSTVIPNCSRACCAGHVTMELMAETARFSTGVGDCRDAKYPRLALAHLDQPSFTLECSARATATDDELRSRPRAALRRYRAAVAEAIVVFGTAYHPRPKGALVLKQDRRSNWKPEQLTREGCSRPCFQAVSRSIERGRNVAQLEVPARNGLIRSNTDPNSDRSVLLDAAVKCSRSG